MPTYRCKSCLGLYVDPQPSGVPYRHACGPLVDPDTHTARPRPDARDENVELDDDPARPRPVGYPDHQPAPVWVRMKSAGRGRELIDPGDVLTAATPEEIADLHKRPAIGPSPLPEVDLNAHLGGA